MIGWEEPIEFEDGTPAKFLAYMYDYIAIVESTTGYGVDHYFLDGSSMAAGGMSIRNIVKTDKELVEKFRSLHKESNYIAEQLCNMGYSIVSVDGEALELVPTAEIKFVKEL